MANKYVFNALTCQYDIIEEGTEGPAGPQGAEGPQGPAGVGVPAGGISGQVLSKSSNNDFATEWITPSGGGSTQGLQSVLDTGESAYDVSIHLSGIAGLYLHGEENRSSAFQSDTWSMRGEDSAPSRMGLNITPSEIYIAEGIDESMPSATAAISPTGNNGAQLVLGKGGDGYVLTTPTTYVNTEVSGTVGTVLMPDTTGDETMATREWVAANSGGGGSSTLDDVLAAGNTSNEKSMTLLGDSSPVSLRITREPRSVTLSSASLAFSNSSESNFDGTTEVQSNLISMATYSGNNEITLSNEIGVGPSFVMTQDGAPRTIALDSSPVAGTFLLPSTDGAEVFATREWVAANSGGGGGSQDLQSVLTAGDVASLPFTLSDTLSSTSFYIANIVMANATGEEVMVNPALLKFEYSSGNSVTLQPNSDYPLIVVRNGVTSSLRAPESGVTSSDIRFPQTSFGPETIATQEWVSNPVPTGNRPASPLEGQMAFDTTLGHPIWFNGTGWVDATGTGV